MLAHCSEDVLVVLGGYLAQLRWRRGSGWCGQVVVKPVVAKGCADRVPLVARMVFETDYLANYTFPLRPDTLADMRRRNRRILDGYMCVTRVFFEGQNGSYHGRYSAAVYYRGKAMEGHHYAKQRLWHARQPKLMPFPLFLYEEHCPWHKT